MTRYTLDTSNTHKYGEILLVGENREDYITVGPKDGDEDAPNYDVAKVVSVALEMYEQISLLAVYEQLLEDGDNDRASLIYSELKEKVLKTLSYLYI